MKYGKYTGNQNEAIFNMLGGESAVDSLLAGKATVILREKHAHPKVGQTIVVPARTAKFVVKHELSVGDYVSGLKITKWYDPFGIRFGEKVEEPTAESELIVRQVTTPVSSIDLVKSLGGEDEVETTFSELHYVLVNHCKEPYPRLLTNGSANIAYIRDVVGVLREVWICRNVGDCWVLSVESIDETDHTTGCCYVVTRKHKIAS